MYWRPGWQPSPPDEWQQLVEEATAESAWIMDGNYGGTMEARVAAADAIIFLDIPRVVCIVRVILRRLKYAGRSRPFMPAGCPERVTGEFLHWIWTYQTRRRPKVLDLLAQAKTNKHVVVLRSSREVRKYLEQLAAAPPGLEGGYEMGASVPEGPTSDLGTRSWSASDQSASPRRPLGERS